MFCFVSLVRCAGNTGIMFLNEVALGKEHSITRDDSSLVKAPSGHDSVVARGHTEPGQLILYTSYYNYSTFHNAVFIVF